MNWWVRVAGEVLALTCMYDGRSSFPVLSEEGRVKGKGEREGGFC